MGKTSLILIIVFALAICSAGHAHFSGQKFCIDPGHGGSDPGAVGQGLQEKAINLDIGLRARDLLQQDSATIVMTRTTDIYVSLQGRCDIANANGANRFVCTHCNAFNGSACGTETFCHPNDSATAYDMRNKVNPEMVSHMGTVNRGVKTADFYVLRNTNMAAILCEVAFIDNASDAAKLGNAAYRQEAARAYLHGMQSHYGQTPHDVGTPALDSAYHSQSYQATMVAGSTAVVWAEYTNTGTETWYNSGGNPVRLGTWNPQDRSSAFYTAGDWIGANRPTNMDQASCAPGQVGRFTFIMTAPQTPGTYTEYWRLLKEGSAWFGYSGVYFQITVTSNKGTITGTIRNANSGNPIPGATVTLNTGQSTQTSGSGTYTIGNLDAGGYTVTASASGYAPNSAPATVIATQTTTVNINLAPTDTQPPSNPTGLTATTISSTQINLSWTASTDNIGVAGYKVFRGGLQVGTTSSTSYADNGLAPNTLYSYQVSAYDLAENNSGLSNTASASTLPTTVAVFQDGFPDLNGWTPDVVADGTTRGVSWDTTHNHGTFAGAGNAVTLVGSAGTNGCWSYKYFPRPFAAGRYEGYFYDSSSTGNDNSRQGIHLRGYQGGTLAFSLYIGTYSATSFGNYCAGIYGLGEGGWRPWQILSARAAGWHKFTIEVLPYTGSNDLKFYVDGLLKYTTYRPAATNTYGISRTYLGHNYNVNQVGWFDDLGFYADPPVAPIPGTPAAQSTTSIRWNYTDNSNNEAGFDLHDSSQAQKGTTGMNTSYITEGSLVANNQYVRHFHGYNGTLDSAPTPDTACYTLSVPPSVGTVGGVGRSANTWYATPEFTFTAVGGFGPGKVQFYRYAWTQSSVYSFTGAEPVWASGDLPLSATAGGSWYLHVQGCNGDSVANGMADLGPYQYDGTPPTAPTVADDGAYTGSTTELHASWSGAEDAESGIARYWYAIGTSPGAADLADWAETPDTSVTRTGLSLTVGTTYYISVKAENGLGMQGALGMSDGITVVQTVADIPTAKGLPDDTLLALDTNIVSANFGSHFYIEDAEPTSGMRVEAESPEEGRELSVAGRLTTIGGERVLADATVFTGGMPGVPDTPVLRNKDLGGERLNPMTPGVKDGLGANNVGLLVTAMGRVSHAEAGFCYIDDGSHLDDGSGFVGVKVDTTTLATEPAQDSFLKVIGISGVELTGSDIIRLLRPRRDADVVTYLDI